MADALEVPDDAEALFLARGDEVNSNRPLYTGDVVTGVHLDVLRADPLTVAVVSHPCAMRAGARLLDHLHVAPVVAHSESGLQMWRGNFKYMALDGLAEAAGLTNPVIRLDRMTLAATDTLDISRRIACLDRPGVNILRQRLVNQLTRVVVPTRFFDEEAGGAHEELDLMENWLTAAGAVGVPLEAAARDFHEWVRAIDGTTTRQRALTNPQAVPSIRRAARSEIQQRYAHDTGGVHRGRAGRAAGVGAVGGAGVVGRQRVEGDVRTRWDAGPRLDARGGACPPAP